MQPFYAHYDPGVPKEAPRPWLLFKALEANAQRFPRRVALEFLGRRYYQLTGLTRPPPAPVTEGSNPGSAYLR
jgi:hypothetical protein